MLLSSGSCLAVGTDAGLGRKRKGERRARAREREIKGEGKLAVVLASGKDVAGHRSTDRGGSS